MSEAAGNGGGGGDAVEELIACVARLGRDCPWTAEQTAPSMLRFLREECAEAEEALGDASASPEAIASELGDILFNALLAIEVHARDQQTAASPEGEAARAALSIDAVARSAVDKLRRRYPPLFDGSLRGLSAGDANRIWSKGKAAEAAVVEEEEEQEVEEEEWDEALAAELAELDRLERDGEEMAERERLAKLVLEELAREAAADGPAQCD